MTPSMLTLDVDGVPVVAAVIHERLEVPMRSLIVGTLGMNYAPQKKRLKGLAQRCAVHLRDLAVGSELCLPAHRLTPYLWTLAPRRPEIRAKLICLQDGWDTALLAWHGVEPDDVGGPGNWLARVLASAPRAAQREAEDLRADKARLQLDLDDVRKQLAASELMAKRLETDPVMSKETFLEMARLHSAGKTNGEIARRFGCSPTSVSLFLNGKYTSAASDLAMAELRDSGWLKNDR